jgi:UDP-glucose 4-epimerase
MARALVTGGAGFIGSHVTRELLDLGHAVVVLDDLSGGFRENVDPRARTVVGSIVDEALVTDLFRTERFDCVYHLAAYAAEGLSHFIRRFNYDNNLIGSVTLINAAVNGDVRCFVYTSSIAVYGENQLPMHEALIPQPEDPYGIAKLAVEQDLKAAARLFGLPWVIFRPHNVYGEHQNIGDRYRNVLGIFMNQILQGQPMTIFGDGTQTRAFTYIGDIAPMIARAPFVPGARGEIFNVGADTATTVNELARVIARAFGVEPSIRYLPAREEVLHAFADHTKARRVFDHHGQTSLEEGVRRMAAWARQTGARASAPFKEPEIPRNLPPSWRAHSQGC